MSFTITTPLYYVNDKPHLGSTYTTIACDAIARFYRLEGEKVVFITGVDEHGLKIQRTAESKGIKPNEHCDKISNIYKELWNKWDITFDSFVRTTSQSHEDIVYQFFKRVQNSGDIKVGRQTGWYCVGCEEFKDVNNEDKDKYCPIHLKQLEWRDEENLFFCLSNYQKQIEKLVNSEDFIQPQSRKNEIIKFVSSGLKDFSISRVNLKWGLPVPHYPGHTFYIWFDALLGYITGAYTNSDDYNLDNINSMLWPANVHIIGKDILRFHAVYWPAMLMSANIKIPLKVFGHGFLKREGQKMGKSLGNVLDPEDLLNKYGKDSVRWFLLKDIDFGQDGDFQKQRFIDIVNNDLCNTIGNLVNRTISMSRKWFDCKVPELINYNNKNHLKECSNKVISEYKKLMYNYNFKEASETILYLATEANIFLNEQAPWTKIKNIKTKEEVAEDIYNVLETCRIIGYLLNPITPELSLRILNQLSINHNILNWKSSLEWGLLNPGNDLPEPIPVMNRIEN